MKTLILILTIFLLASCGKKQRIIEIIDSDTLKPAANLNVSISPGNNAPSGEVSVSSTDQNGKAVFGDGNWNEINEFISIKVTKNDKVLFDFVRKSPNSNTITLTIQQKEKTDNK